jgi:hypothetical protein
VEPGQIRRGMAKPMWFLFNLRYTWCKIKSERFLRERFKIPEREEYIRTRKESFRQGD